MKKLALTITVLGCLLLFSGCVSNTQFTELEAKFQECLEVTEAQEQEAVEAMKIAEAQRKIAEEQREFAHLTVDSLASELKRCQEGKGN